MDPRVELMVEQGMDRALASFAVTATVLAQLVLMEREKAQQAEQRALGAELGGKGQGNAS